MQRKLNHPNPKVQVRAQQRGTALLVVVALIGFLTIFASAFPGLAALQSLTARKFATKTQATYLARAGIEIGLSDLTMTPQAFSQLARSSSVDSSYTITEGQRVDVSVLPASMLLTSKRPQFISTRLHDHLKDIDRVIKDREQVAPGDRPPLMAIVAKGVTGSGKRLRATTTVVSLARVSPAGISIVYWFEE